MRKAGALSGLSLGWRWQVLPANLLFSTRAFVSSHASDERQDRQLLHWLQETTSPRRTSPGTCAVAERQRGCASVAQPPGQLWAPRSAPRAAGSCQNRETAGRGEFPVSALKRTYPRHLAARGFEPAAPLCSARKRLGYSR